MEDRDKVWAEAAERIIAKRSGKVLAVAAKCMPWAYRGNCLHGRTYLTTVGGSDTNDSECNLVENSQYMQNSVSPVAGQSRAFHDQTFRNSSGHGRPWYGWRRLECAFIPRRWETVPMVEVWVCKGGDRSVENRKWQRSVPPFPLHDPR
ncbi:hypothetical protein DPMN_070101 [Dreissena polymorpha]|uniref:Uncharacterized protein n=1 Tax=Dreissena polymorpha TaxID=45954 RepID=A0A9D4BVE8_DREPO|nr:hypothetical protein DPMN_070101 [Dreissena polymorpha]